jgi:hypothetical protein
VIGVGVASELRSFKGNAAGWMWAAGSLMRVMR